MKGYVGYTFREPLGSLVAEYERHFLTERHWRTTPRLYSKGLWRFFSKFPRKSSPEQFAMADVEDWKVWRLEEGAAYSTMRFECCVVKAFFSWLINERPGGEFADLANPMTIPRWPRPE